MKISLLITLALLSGTVCAQQPSKAVRPEMDIYDGLMYAAADMQQLKKAADSLNLQYLECIAQPVYYSLPQTQALRIKLQTPTKDTTLIVARLRQHIPLAQILREFPGLVMEDSGHVVLAWKPRDTEYDNEYDTVLYSGNANGFNTIGLNKQAIWDNCICSLEYLGEYTNIYIWRLDKPFSRLQLPQEYAKMVQYVDCMIDTGTVLMLNKGNLSEEENAPLDSLKMLVLLKRHKLPTGPLKYTGFDERDKKYIQREFNNNPRIRQLFANAVTVAMKNGSGSGQLEWLAEGVSSKDTILLMKRSRIVIGGCSMDDAPRQHARNIATLASQTHQWPVFIRAHLDIMNDYFMRATDASYAQPMRKTYLRELELLDIPAQRLLLGSVFKVSNAPAAHYYGNISRIGRAFTESAHAADFEKAVKGYMKDQQLDPFNKCLFFLLYASYCYQQPEAAETKTKISELKELKAYPEYIQAGIHGLKE